MVPQIAQSSVSFSGISSKSGEALSGTDLEDAIGVAISEMDQKTASQSQQTRKRGIGAVLLIVLLGCVASAAFLAVGITASHREQREQFDSLAKTLVIELEHTWRDYQTAALWIHESAVQGDGWMVDTLRSRTAFRDLYEHMISTGLKVQAAEFIPRVEHADREALEESAAFWYAAEHPGFSYVGFTGMEDSEIEAVKIRSVQPFYYPSHFVEPVESNEIAIDFDLLSEPNRRDAVNWALESWEPSLTNRIRLIQETEHDAYSVLLMHPGIKLTSHPDRTPGDLSLLSIRIPTLLEEAVRKHSEAFSVYLYDEMIHEDERVRQQVFLGAVSYAGEELGTVKYLNEITIHELKRRNSHRRYRVYTEKVAVCSRVWTVAVVSSDLRPTVIYVALGGAMILVGCISLGLWIYSNMKRQAKLTKIKRDAEAEKAALFVESAQKATRAERELNDFIAHEVRNPLSAALSANAFVTSAINDGKHETKSEIMEDLYIVESSLHFINDLLRNMLDMQRAKSNQLNVKLAPVDMMEDILRPVDAMLYRRGANIKVEVECKPENLVVQSDRLRLKQIVLNLGRNSLKFVDKGFIRLRAAVDKSSGFVKLFVEDSGPGIPLEKRRKLFAKFQESLDSLHQGTGIGLALCQNLIELMGGEISLDESFNSGIEGLPGTRFVISLNKKPILLDDSTILEQVAVMNRGRRSLSEMMTTPMNRSSLMLHETNEVLPSDDLLDFTESSRSSQSSSLSEIAGVDEAALPSDLSVLFVDDDMVLRKLFARSVRKMLPSWKVQEAASGEAALKLIEQDPNQFQIIWVDQYMASVEKQLLGTETVRAMRALGCRAKICGQSANDIQRAFEEAGADAFMFKPFPTKPLAMKKEFVRILEGKPQPNLEFAMRMSQG